MTHPVEEIADIKQGSGASAVADQALVNDAPTGHHPAGFDPSRKISRRNLQIARDLTALKFGYVLHYARIAQGVTREELSARVNRSVDLIAKVERGEHHGSLDVLSDMALGLGCEFEFRLVDRPRDSDGSGEASETRSGSTEGDSADPKGIAQKDQPHD